MLQTKLPEFGSIILRNVKKLHIFSVGNYFLLSYFVKSHPQHCLGLFWSAEYILSRFISDILLLGVSIFKSIHENRLYWFIWYSVFGTVFVCQKTGFTELVNNKLLYTDTWAYFSIHCKAHESLSVSTIKPFNPTYKP